MEARGLVAPAAMVAATAGVLVTTSLAALAIFLLLLRRSDPAREHDGGDEEPSADAAAAPVVLVVPRPSRWWWWWWSRDVLGLGLGLPPWHDARPAPAVVDLLRRHACVLLRSYYAPDEVRDFAGALVGLAWQQQRRASFLGCFDFVRFGVADAPPLLRPYVRKLMAAAPDVPFTHAWIQRYDVGHFVAEHCDPGTYRGCVAIGVFGDFVGAVSTIEGVREEGRPGDVFLLRAKLDDRLPMPLHQVSPVVWGTRYIILLTAVDPVTRTSSVASASSSSYL